METVADFGPYSLVRAIARSSSAVSFLARFAPAAEGERLVALKFLRNHVTQEPGYTERLVAEVRAATRLNHVNVAQTFDIAGWDDRVYVTLEYVDGAPLAALTDRLRSARRAAPHDVAAFVLSEICGALGYAHARRDDRGQPAPVCHGDIRPRSILLSYAGEVKTVGFGIAISELAIGGERALRQEDRLQFTAPEIAEGGPQSVAGDIFAAGAIAYLLLTGRMLYDGVAGAELLTHARRGTFTPPREVDASIPEDLQAIVLAALARDPSARVESATELRNQISAWLRRTSPGFGRHRLKSFLQKELADRFQTDSAENESKPLTRREWVAADPDSLLAPPSDPTSRPKSAAAGQFVLREEAAALDAPFTTAPTGAAQQAKGQLPVPGARPGPVVTPRTTSPKKQVEVFATRDIETDESDDDAASTGEATVSAARDARTRPNLDIPKIVTDPDLDDTPEAPPAAVSAPARPTWDPASVAGAVYDDSVDPDLTKESLRELRQQRRPERSPIAFVGVALAAFALLGGGAFFALQKYNAAMAAANTSVDRSPSVFVTSRPQGATIVVDGTPTQLTTPAPITGLRAGQEVSVSVNLPGYDTAAPQTVTVDRNHQTQVLVQLEPGEHRIRLDSDPQGANVLQNGVAIGQTPASIGPLRIDYRSGADFVVSLDGYLDERVAVDWEPGAAESALRVTLRPDPNWVAPPVQTP